MPNGTHSRTLAALLATARRSFLIATFGLVFTSALPRAYAQGDDLTPHPEVLETKDNYKIAITYYPSELKEEAAVVVLLHGLSGNQLDWGTLPKQLHDEKYAVITVDLRGHGQSKGGLDDVETKANKNKSKTAKGGLDAANLRARDFQAMVLLDMEAVKRFIYEENQKKRLNMNRTAFIGAGMGADVALRAAAEDWLKKPHSDGPVGNQTPRGQDVRALVLLTPDGHISGLPLPDAIKLLRGPDLQVAIMFGVGKKDKLDRNETKKLYDQTVTIEKNKDRMYLREYNSAGRGTALLGKGLETELNISNFLEAHLLKIDSKWRDRETKVGRKKAS